MKRPNGHKSNAEHYNSISAYDFMVQINEGLRKLPNTYVCIMDALGDDVPCRADTCEECIRLWRLENFFEQRVKKA